MRVYSTHRIGINGTDRIGTYSDCVAITIVKSFQCRAVSQLPSMPSSPKGNAQTSDQGSRERCKWMQEKMICKIDSKQHEKSRQCLASFWLLNRECSVIFQIEAAATDNSCTGYQQAKTDHCKQEQATYNTVLAVM